MTTTMTDERADRLKVCGTCESWCIGFTNTYCDLLVSREARDADGVIDWELNEAAIKGPHDTCRAWACW